MDDYNVPVLVDAKSEYTQQLISTLTPHFYEGILSIYQDCTSMVNEDTNQLMAFQNLLGRIPQWSQDMIERETNRIIECSHCDWLEDLITAVFVSHTKILTAIRVGKKHKKINVKVPKVDHFIHKAYIEIAREFWKNPYLFQYREDKCDYQKNLNTCEKIIQESIQKSIRSQLPVKHILQEYLGGNYQEEFDESEDSSDDEIEDKTEDVKKSVAEITKTMKNDVDDEIEKGDSKDINENSTAECENIVKDTNQENSGEINTREDISLTNDNASKETITVDNDINDDDNDVSKETNDSDVSSAVSSNVSSAIVKENLAKETNDSNVSSATVKEGLAKDTNDSEDTENKSNTESIPTTESKITLTQTDIKDTIDKKDTGVDEKTIKISDIQQYNKDQTDSVIATEVIDTDIGKLDNTTKSVELPESVDLLDNNNTSDTLTNVDLLHNTDLLNNDTLETVSLQYDLPEINTEVKNELDNLNDIKEISIPEVPTIEEKPLLFPDANEEDFN